MMALSPAMKKLMPDTEMKAAQQRFEELVEHYTITGSMHFIYFRDLCDLTRTLWNCKDEPSPLYVKDIDGPTLPGYFAFVSYSAAAHFLYDQMKGDKPRIRVPTVMRPVIKASSNACDEEVFGDAA